MQWIKPAYKYLWSKVRFDFETDVRISQRRASPWLSPLIVPDEPHQETKHSRSTASSYAAPSRFTVERDNQPYLVAFDKAYAVMAVNALKARGFHAVMYEGTEKPSKRSYEHSARMVLAPIKAAPQRLHSPSSTHVHYWGEQGRLPIDTLTYHIEAYDIRLKAWVMQSTHDYQPYAEAKRKRHERIRVVFGDRVYGFQTVQILHDDPRLPVA